MYVEDGVPLLVGHLLNHRIPGVPGIVDDDVQAAEGVDGGPHEALAEIGVGDAADAGDGPAARRLDGGDGVLGGLGVEIVDDDARTLGGEFERDLAADAATRAGDNGT
jgi:hypothetical protein